MNISTIMENKKHESLSNTLGIIGLILGILTILFSFITCFGFFSIISSMVSVLISLIGLIIAVRHKHPKVLSITAIVLSFIGLLIVSVQFLKMTSIFNNLAQLENKGQQSIFFEEIGWELKMPSTWSIEYNRAIDSLKVKTIPDYNSSEDFFLIKLKKNERGSFSASLAQLNKSNPKKWVNDFTKFKKNYYNLCSEFSVSDSTSGKEIIDNVTFEFFNVKSSPRKGEYSKTYENTFYKANINQKLLTISFYSEYKTDKEKLLKAIRSSKFSLSEPKKE